jgi:hypothetical protein
MGSSPTPSPTRAGPPPASSSARRPRADTPEGGAGGGPEPALRPGAPAPPPSRRGAWRRWLAAPVLVLAAVVLLVEEWLWDDLARLAAAIGRLPPFRWIEPLVRALPPWGALILFGAPTLLLVPVKVTALWLLARGHPTLGLLVLVAAKIGGTAMLARIYALTRPQLLRIGWFAWLDAWVHAFKARVHEAVRATVVYQAVRAAARRLRAAAVALVRRREGASWRRRWEAALRFSRRRARP